jgi:hypothetical protein
LLVALMMGASEFGGEVIKLHTTDESGARQTTSLWIVEDEGALWLRAGQNSSGWFERLKAKPEVELERDGRTRSMRAVPVPEKRDRIHELMRRDYGWADAIIGATRDGSGSVAVRLDPL